MYKPHLLNPGSSVKGDLSRSVIIRRSFSDLNDEKEICWSGMRLGVACHGRPEEGKIWLGLRVGTDGDRSLHSDNRSVAQSGSEAGIQAVDTERMAGANRSYLDDLSLNELHSVILFEDSRLDHPMVFLNRKPARAYHNDHV